MLYAVMCVRFSAALLKISAKISDAVNGWCDSFNLGVSLAGSSSYVDDFFPVVEIDVSRDKNENLCTFFVSLAEQALSSSARSVSPRPLSTSSSP